MKEVYIQGIKDYINYDINELRFKRKTKKIINLLRDLNDTLEIIHQNSEEELKILHNEYFLKFLQSYN